jgi:flagellar assembly factor FliW
MEISTSGFGKISFSSKDIYKFSKGIYGFPELKKFILSRPKEIEPFVWLQSIEKPNVALLLVNPFLLHPNYDPQVQKKELKDIKLTSLKKAEIYVIVTIPPDIKQAQANLLSPLMINPEKKLGKQVVLKGSDYKIHHLIFDLMEKERHSE